MYSKLKRHKTVMQVASNSPPVQPLKWCTYTWGTQLNLLIWENKCLNNAEEPHFVFIFFSNAALNTLRHKSGVFDFQSCTLSHTGIRYLKAEFITNYPKISPNDKTACSVWLWFRLSITEEKRQREWIKWRLIAWYSWPDLWEQRQMGVG